LVDYFVGNNIKIKDVSCGKDHTLAVAENGDVYSWGYGGEQNFIYNLI